MRTNIPNRKPRFWALATAALTLLGSVGFVGPAALASTYPVQTRVSLEEIATAETGGVHQIKGQIVGTLGSETGYVDYGTVTVYRQLAGEPGFSSLGTVAVGKTFSFTAPAIRNAIYRITYGGGTEVSGGNTYNYAPATLDALGPTSRSLRVAYQARFRGRFGVRVTVAPEFARGRVLVQQDPSCTGSWVAAGAMKANKRGVASRRFPIRGSQTCFRFVVPGDASYAQSASAVRAYRL